MAIDSGINLIYETYIIFTYCFINKRTKKNLFSAFPSIADIFQSKCTLGHHVNVNTWYVRKYNNRKEKKRMYPTPSHPLLILLLTNTHTHNDTRVNKYFVSFSSTAKNNMKQKQRPEMKTFQMGFFFWKCDRNWGFVISTTLTYTYTHFIG